MQHFAIIVGFLHHISQAVVNQPLLIGVIEIGRWASCDLKKHEESKVHRMAALQYVEAKCMQVTGDSVSQQLSRAYNSEVQLNRRNVRRIFELILLFGRQRIAYRGHDESGSSLNRGNLLEFLHYKARECPELATHLAGSIHYTSAKI